MNTRRLLLSPLVFLIALTAMLGLNASSAAAGGGLETRVRAFDHVTVDIVAASSGETAASGGCLRPSSTAIASGSCVATNTAGSAFHHTTDQAVESIMRSGLRPGSYATPTQGLSPLQAHIELALNPAGGRMTGRIV